MITDRKVLDQLITHFADRTEAAVALGLGEYPQFYFNWRRRGVPRGWRYVVWMACSKRGIAVDKDWCRATKSKRERAVLKRSLRWIAQHAGAADGKAEGKRQKDERSTAERRPATGRNIPAPPR